MLHSMTGHGQGRLRVGSSEIAVEVRAVNNRHLKVQTRTSDGLGSLEQKIEALARQRLRRGSIQLNVQVSGDWQANDYNLRGSVIEHYVGQCRSLAGRLGLESQVAIRDLLMLPGVIAEPRWSDVEIDEQLANSVLSTVAVALESLDEMRRTEGESMAIELRRQLGLLRTQASDIELRSPEVIEAYRSRLNAKLTRALAEVGASLQDGDLVREVLLMADKADIREEIVRLRSHIDQFETLISEEDSQGRKLDFLIQEMFRETNTIGSKSGDAFIAQRVVDMKTGIEQMRELVQNVE